MDCLKHYSSTLVAVGVATAAAAATASVYLATQPDPFISTLDLDNQSVILEDGSRQHPGCLDGKLMEYLYEDAKTLPEAFLHGLKASKNGPCLAARTGPNLEYEWLSYQEVYDTAQAVGSGLIHEGLHAKNDTFVGIYSKNRPEYTICDLACVMFSMVPVPLYDTLGKESRLHIINTNELTHIICDSSEKAQNLLSECEKIPKVKCIIVMETISPDQQEKAKMCGIKLIRLNQLQADGQKNIQDTVFPKPSDLAVICYTSGTTGIPKGAMITHLNMISNTAAIIDHIDEIGPICSNDVHMSYLPMAHMYERTMQMMVLMQGGRVGFFRGDPLLLFEDMQELKPTTITFVPRILNKIYNKISASVSTSKLKSYLFKKALQSKTEDIACHIFRNNSIWDYLVFRKIHQLIGGRARMVLCGSAPLDKSVLEFSRCAFGCFFIEGYGQTEANAGISLHTPGENRTGHVGIPVKCNIMKLVDVPEMGFYAADNKGEICAKGPNIFKGYYKNPEKTAEAIDQDGWLHTGDIGELLPNGTFRVIDRIKHIFKLSQGEYIAPEKIEIVYARSKFVAQCFVDGHSKQDFVVAIVIPDEDVVFEWAKEQGLSPDMIELVKSKLLKETIFKDMREIGVSAGLNSLELVKNIFLYHEAFSMTKDLLTPTLKSKRPQLRDYFRQHIEDMYKEGREATTGMTNNNPGNVMKSN